MNVIVLVEGREAIPVRAIPLLTNWQVMSPDEIASALAHEENYENFHGMDAYSLENGAVTPIPANWWERFPCRHLKAISERLKATELSHEVGYQSWREESHLVLPAGAFVWKDEFEMCYQKVYGPSGWKIWRTHVALPFEKNEVIEGEERVLTREEKKIERKARVREREERVRERVLNFNPFIPPNRTAMVMEGFELQQTDSQPQAVPVETVLVVPENASGGVSWTLKKPVKFQGYGRPLYALLKAAHIAGQACPTARDVLEAWREKTPPEVALVLAHSLDYYNVKEVTKPAGLDAIRKAIARMTC